MVLQNLFPQMCCVNVCIDLSSGYRFMTKHSLNGTKISTTFQQRGRKRMPKRMR